MAGELETALTERDRRELLRIARESVAFALGKQRPLATEESSEGIDARGAAFVTIKTCEGGLRGCVGTFERDKPLRRVVAEFAGIAAFHDGRFRPVEAGELRDLRFEISVLSPLMERANPLDFELGRHGVWVVGSGGESGTFLPQVAAETGWSKEQFLSHCCSHKAGIAADAWRDAAKCTVYVYTADVFSE